LTITAQANPIYGKIARFAFFLYLFFIFFGTALPFRPPVETIDEKGTSNVVNQIVFTSLFLLGAASLWARREDAAALLKKEKWLTIFLFWCFLSLFWSDYPFVSFKRLFQIYTTVIVILAALIWKGSSRELIDTFRVVVYLYIVASIASVLFVPGAMEPKMPAWRAFAPSKNHLGQATLICTFLCCISLSAGGELKRKLTDIVMLGLSLILLFGAKSVTSTITLFLIFLLWGVLALNKRFQTLGVGNFFLFFAGVAGVVFAVMMSRFPDEIQAFFQFFERDMTFTGRTSLWLAVFEYTKEHLFLGAGIGGFWVVENPAVLKIYQEYVWLPNQAHSGYVDILNETGLVGFMVFGAMVGSFFIRYFRSSLHHPWIWFFLVALITNFQESTIFRLNILTGVLFLFSYLALHYDLLRHESEPKALSSEMEYQSALDDKQFRYRKNIGQSANFAARGEAPVSDINRLISEAPGKSGKGLARHLRPAGKRSSPLPKRSSSHI
jgi:exopolysaccharide production protein ExoQ